MDRPTPFEGLEGDEGARDVRRLGVVYEQHAVTLCDLLEAVGDAGERAQRIAHRFLVDPPRQADGGRGHRVLNVVAPSQPQFVQGSSGRSSHHSCPAASARSAPGPLPKQTRRAQPPRSATPSPSGATATSSLPWRAKISSLALR